MDDGTKTVIGYEFPSPTNQHKASRKSILVRQLLSDLKSFRAFWECGCFEELEEIKRPANGSSARGWSLATML